mmetsp:Transcript_24551/g.56979  ORF Transcript_24551/g.56979 Transcript_24551/m.56979 type:complete len:95 (-) Transcript_24551:107-391(-)
MILHVPEVAVLQTGLGAGPWPAKSLEQRCAQTLLPGNPAALLDRQDGWGASLLWMPEALQCEHAPLADQEMTPLRHRQHCDTLDASVVVVVVLE